MGSPLRNFLTVSVLAVINLYLLYRNFLSSGSLEIQESEYRSVPWTSDLPGELELKGEKMYPRIKATLDQLKQAQQPGSTRKVIFIVSDFRSGSSLLGEMFNQNNEVFYMFEPLKGMTLSEKKLLTDIFSCGAARRGFLRRNRQSGCPYAEGDYSSTTTMHCLKTINSTRECLKYPITAAKFIRLRNLEYLEQYGLLKMPNMYIIHSFRDPRGTFNSRLQFGGQVINYNGKIVKQSELTVETVGNIAESLCQRYLGDVMFGESFKHKYIRVGYEDLCTDPDTNIKKVYNLIGEEPPRRVFEWYKNHTQASSNSAATDTMGMLRDAKRTAERWKQELKMEFICAIEDKCGELFDYLGLEYACVGP